MRHAIAIIAAVLTSASFQAIDCLEAQSCGDCKPPRLNRGWDLRDGTHYICFESNTHHTWTDTQRTNWMKGFDWLKNTLSSVGKSAQFEARPAGACGSGDIKIVALDFSTTSYPDQAGAAHGTSDGTGAKIEINKKYVGGVPGYGEHNWEYVGAHDGSHLVDLDDMHSPPYPSGCKSMSIMFFEQGTPPSDPCGDRLVLDEKYNPPPPPRRDDDGDGYSPDDEWGSSSWDCDDTDPSIGNLCPAPYAPVGCPECDPIVMPVAANSGFRFTSAADGVLFDLDGDGLRERVSWTAAGGGLAFLAIDRNANGAIDDGTELFGGRTVAGQTNGFAALLTLMPQDRGDASQGGLSRIDENDPIWAHLLLWEDRNHDGRSDPGELRSVSDLYTSISAEYDPFNRRDRYANTFQFRGTALWRHGSPDVDRRRFIYDVFLVR